MTTTRTENETSVSRRQVLEYLLRTDTGPTALGRDPEKPEDYAIIMESEDIARECFNAFTSLNFVPEDVIARLLFILKVTSMGYCGGLTREVEDWHDNIWWAVFQDVEDDIILLSDYADNNGWREHYLYRQAFIWLNYLQGKTGQVEDGLRVARETHDNPRLQHYLSLDPSVREEDEATMVDRNLHEAWMKAAVATGEFVDDTPSDKLFKEADEMFSTAILLTEKSEDERDLHNTLVWLAAASRVMMQGMRVATT